MTRKSKQGGGGGQWIQKAMHHPGSFDRYCNSHGFKGASSSCISMGKKSKSRNIERKAIFANTLEHLHHKGRHPRK